MKESNFFRSNAFYIGLGVLVLGVIAFVLLRPKPPSTKNCYTVSWTDLNSMLGDGFNDPTNPNYALGISFKTESTDPVKITAYLVAKDLSTIPDKNVVVTVSDPENCKLPDLKIADNVYQFVKDDADGSGGLFKFSYLKLTAEASAESGDMLAYKLEFITESDGGGETTVKTAYAKPCPPYCPRPLE